MTVNDEMNTPPEGKIQEPVEVPAPQTAQGVSFLERLSPTWIAWFVVVAITLTTLIAVWMSLYVGLASEEQEKADYDQLSKIVDPLQGLATLMIGTIFGFTAQSGATAMNKRTADKNKDEADAQNDKATENAKRARANAKVAAIQADTASELREALAAVRQYYEPPADSSAQLMVTRSLTRSARPTPTRLEDYIDQVLAKADDTILDATEYRRFLDG